MNHLKDETSPYLLQHKDNAVDWHPWGEAAFELAKTQAKPIFLSVGYSTCHWCHVMAHESFEDQEVGEVLNKDFICIKVDREERPDVDHVYMQALQVISGGGGWPMSVWLTPEGRAFFAGTYFPKYRFLQVLRRITEIWNTEPDKLHADGERLLEAVVNSRGVGGEGADEASYEEFLKTYINHFQNHFDEANGGFNAAPKFPQSMNLLTMMRRDHGTGLMQAQAMVTTTLLKMIRGGIHDQLGGGFHRYSVDEKWLVPHFEKMLYDQSMLLQTLAEAFTLYKEPEFERAARSTADFVLRELTHPRGGFYSAQDADSLNPATQHSEEGYYYTFTFAELTGALTASELLSVQQAFGVTPGGNFDGRNILNLQEGYSGQVIAEPEVRSALSKLKSLRDLRPTPHLDDKIIAAWNGWMIAALVKSANAFNEPAYLQAAQKALKFLRTTFWQKGRLQRSWRGDVPGRLGQAEDYASVIHAALELYQSDFDPQWAEWAIELQDVMDKLFWDVEEGAYFSNDGTDPCLPLRLKDDYDGVSPGSNSMAAFNLSRLYLLTGESKYNQKANQIFSLFFNKLKTYPSGLPYLALALDFHLSGAKVAVFNGTGWSKQLWLEEKSKFYPHLLWACGGKAWPLTLDKTGGDESVYVCEAGRCFKPATSIEEARTQIT